MRWDVSFHPSKRKQYQPLAAICNSLLNMLASEAVSSFYHLRMWCYSGNIHKCVLLTSEIKLYGYFCGLCLCYTDADLCVYWDWNLILNPSYYGSRKSCDQTVMEVKVQCCKNHRRSVQSLLCINSGKYWVRHRKPRKCAVRGGGAVSRSRRRAISTNSNLLMNCSRPEQELAWRERSGLFNDTL
jgi:hypothetical protein